MEEAREFIGEQKEKLDVGCVEDAKFITIIGQLCGGDEPDYELMEDDDFKLIVSKLL